MRNWGYQTYQDQAAYTKGVRKKMVALVAMRNELGVSAAVYTQTTDVEGEVNGLMTYDRKFVKIDAAKLRELNAPLTGENKRMPLPPPSRREVEASRPRSPIAIADKSR